MSFFTEHIRYTRKQPHILLDSGAYSIWKSGKSVDISRYAAYLPTVSDAICAAVNLDIIPGGAAGGGATENEIEHACIVSYDRWLQLRELNVTVMPVVHQVDNVD